MVHNSDDDIPLPGDYDPSEDDDEDQIDALDRLLREADELPPPPVGMDGTFARMPRPDPIPEASPRTMICLRGPCQHYVEIITRAQTMNARGTLPKAPRSTNRFCTVIPSGETDLTDELVEECSHWTPRDELAVKSLEALRATWREAHAAELAPPSTEKEKV